MVARERACADEHRLLEGAIRAIRRQFGQFGAIRATRGNSGQYTGGLRWKNETEEFGDTFSQKEKEVSGHAGGRKWFKYSPDFKRKAVDRIVAGESPTAVARELGIRCKFLYAWKAEGKGSPGVPAPAEEVDADPQQREIAKLQKKISELERLAGRQTAELDFFAAALRSVKETRRKSGAGSGAESIK